MTGIEELLAKRDRLNYALCFAETVSETEDLHDRIRENDREIEQQRNRLAFLEWRQGVD